LDKSRLTRAAGSIGLALLAAASAFLLYGPTLGYGFHYDDYAFIRPHSLGDLQSSFVGSWDRTGIMVPFYRPLTVAFHAARFELFGLNADAHHAAGLAMFAACATLAGLVVLRFSRSRAAAALAVLFFVTHPSMTYAQAVWITNQMHLVESLVVLSALVWWHVVAARRLVWWLPLLLLAAAAFLIKEDGVMLVPVILALHWIRRRLAEPALPHPPLAFVLLAAGLLVALILARAEALGQLGGYGQPTAAGAWRNFTVGLSRVLRLVPADRPWQPAASWYATLLPLVALAAWRRAPAHARVLVAAGAVMAILFNVPFVFVTKHEQMHLVASGAVVILAGSAYAVVQVLPHLSLRALATGGAIAGILAFAAVARDISTDFEPFGPIVLAHDEIVRGWAAVPDELREYLASKREPGAAARVSANPAEAIPFVAFGLHPTEYSRLRPFRWMSQSTSEIHVARGIDVMTIPLRHNIGAFREPARVTIHSDGRLVDELTLEDMQWRVSQIAFRDRYLPLLAKMHRVRITIPHAWVPAERIPRSKDHRTLGIQIGALEIRRTGLPLRP
jgi:hypothetical protein